MMPTPGPPGMLRWAVAVARVSVNGVPMLIAVVFAGLILFMGIFLGKQQRAYALKAARCVIDMIRTMGPQSDPNRLTQGEDDSDTKRIGS